MEDLEGARTAGATEAMRFTMICLLSGSDVRASCARHMQERFPDEVAERYFPLAPDKREAFLGAYVDTLTMFMNAARRRH